MLTTSDLIGVRPLTSLSSVLSDFLTWNNIEGRVEPEFLICTLVLDQVVQETKQSNELGMTAREQAFSKEEAGNGSFQMSVNTGFQEDDVLR